VNPLKQGLKLFLYTLLIQLPLVKVVNPLKQGLKQTVEATLATTPLGLK